MGIKSKSIIKKVVIYVLCIASILNMILSGAPLIAKGDSSSVLGTNKALGSPILNSKATTDNWNKWEMICWGVFLSNFCQPLIDTYESAFSTSSNTGSYGAGYKALCFGSGSDSENNKIIENFTTYAIQVEQSSQKKPIYVAYTHVGYDSEGCFKIGDKPDPNAVDDVSGILREATLDDFFFNYSTEVAENKTNIKFTHQGTSDNYSSIATVKEGYIPTFYIKSATNSSKYTVILDYMNSWDLQAFSAMCNAVRTNTATQDYQAIFENKLHELYGSGAKVGMDCFGNLVLFNGTMVFPAAANQNITTEKSINILNSWFMNSYVSNYSTEDLLAKLHQSKMEGWLIHYIDGFGEGGSTDLEYAGLPAFGNSEITGAGFFYYDTDSAAIMNEVKTGGSSFANFKDYIYELFDSDIKSSSNKLPLEYEVAGVNNRSYITKWSDTKNSKKLIEATIMASSALVNYVHGAETKNTKILHELINTNGTTASLIGDKAVVIPVQVVTPSTDKFADYGEPVRHYYNFLYQVYSGNISDSTSGLIDKNTLISRLDGVKTVKDLKDKTDSSLWNSFTSCNSKFRDIKAPSTWSDVGKNESIVNACSRLVKVYPTSQVMQTVSSVLSIADGTEFSVYSTMIYMTYLDWYGVVNKETESGGTEAQSKFDPAIFDPTSDVMNVNPDDIADLMTEEELETEVLHMGYLMLSPEAGREYRKQMIYNGISDFLYEQYNRIVYGGSSSIYSGSSTKSNSGFLAVPTFDENFLTSWFLDGYIDISVVLIIVCTILIIVIGLLKGRKFSWFMLGIFTVVNVILLVPSSGEITPAITTAFTQKIFSSKMTYWTFSEGIANASLEATAASQSKEFEGLTEEGAAVVQSLINQLSVVYTDRSLMLKQDVSQKLTQPLNDSVYSEIQSISSARWILPMVMQQFSAADQDSGKYVYVKLSNVWDDGSNIYWYYNPTYAGSVTKLTTTSSQFRDGEAVTADKVSTGNGGKTKYNNESSTGSYIGAEYYTDYKDADWADDTSTTMNYACYSYTRNKDLNLNVHLYSYILHDQTLGFNNTALRRTSVFGDNFENYKNADSWQLWIDTATANLTTSNWETTKGGSYGYEDISDKYDRTKASTMHDGYGYYKTTESPYYYFFNVVKDSLPQDKTVGAIIGRLQGTIEKNSQNEDVRSNFMYATITANREKESQSGKIENTDVQYTGYVRDVLDLQQLFTNTVPYMYEMTLATGGFDGDSGILVDDNGNTLLISEESDFYEGNNQSWAYRCNWAVKLMENNNYCKPASAKLADGTRVTIQNPMLPECYEAVGRKMVFSEAQREAYGLKDGDLTLVELKCIEVNKAVARDWTLLINYAGTSGLTKEVIFRVMATDATEIFCQEFSTSGVLDTRYEIYPQSVDLRYLSFDAVMKLLMMNVSKDTGYTYGDAMDTLLNDSDLFTAFLLLLCALLCASVIPLCQQIIMAAIFYLGFIAIIRALFSSAAYKGRVAGAQLVSNIVFMIYTICYYLILSLLMSLSSSDEVLSVNSIGTNPGNPIWMLLIVIIASCAYVWLMYKHLCFCFAHYRDMGAEMVEFMTSAVVGKLQDTATSIRDSVTGLFNDDSSTGSGSGVIGFSGTGLQNSPAQDVNIQQSNDSTIQLTKDNSDLDNTLSEENAASAYSTGDTIMHDNSTTSADIDAEIKAGEQLGSDS